MEVYKLTLEQRNQLIGQTYDGVQFFNTNAIDADGNYYVSQEVYSMLTYVKAVEIGVDSWWITLPLIPYNPIVREI